MKNGVVVATRLKWSCRCECGKTIIAEAHKLRTGHTQSCGCLQKERAAETKTTHGGTCGPQHHRLYRLYRGMLERCFYEKHAAWKYYGGRGVSVCPRWRESFGNFRDDMAPSFREGLTLDRIDCFGDYSPENCKWSTPSEQRLNQRHIKMGVSRVMPKWSSLRRNNWLANRAKRSAQENAPAPSNPLPSAEAGRVHDCEHRPS